MKIPQMISVVGAFGLGIAFGFVVKLQPAKNAPVQKNTGIKTPESMISKSISISPVLEISSNVTSDSVGQALQERSHSKRLEKFYTLLSGLTAQNAKEIVEAVRNLKGIPDKSNLLNIALKSWAAEDPQAAMNYAQALPKGEERRQALLGVLGEWAGTDLVSAQNWVNAQTGSIKKDAQKILISSVAEKNPDQVLAMIQAGTFKYSADVSYSLFEEMAARDPVGMISRAESMPKGVLKTLAFDSIAREWAKQDGIAAMGWAQQLPAGKLKMDTTAQLMDAWAIQDFDSASAWIKQQPAGPDRDSFIERVSNGYHDPQDSIALALLMSPGNSQDGVLSYIAMQWATFDSTAAQAWANQQTDPTIQSKVLNGIISGLIQIDPAAAGQLASSLKEGNDRNSALSNVAQFWANSNPAQAAQWALQLTNESDRQNALSRIADSWASNDTSGAIQWINTFSPGAIRDLLIHSTSNSLLKTDPQVAIQLVNSINDPNYRVTELTNLAANWMRNDPVAASIWISSSNLPDATKTRLLKTN